MGYRYIKLSGKIVECFGTQYNFAVAMGMSERSMSLRLNGRIPWKSTDIDKAVELLGLDQDDITSYFFDKKVHAK